MNTKKYFDESKVLKDRYRAKYFCICDSCGAISWLDYTSTSGEFPIEMTMNELLKNGETLFPSKIIFLLLINANVVRPILCSECEKELEPISFKDVNKEMRMKVYKMTPEERINFVNGYWISDRLREQ